MANEPPAIRGVVFDLDGTLYLQRPLRWSMLRQLARLPFEGGGLRSAFEIVRRLRTFRAVREELRALGRPDEPLEELQYRVPAERLGVAPEELRSTVVEWIHERPLALLAPLVRRGILELLEALRGAGVRTAVFSDYPARRKLDALGLGAAIELDLTSTDPDVNAFKPHPRGFLVAAERLGLSAAETLYVGDRDEVDGSGARAAGMPVTLLSRSGPERALEAELVALRRRVLADG